MKFYLYGVVVLCFVCAGTLDLCVKQWKLGIVALLFACANGVISFWR